MRDFFKGLLGICDQWKLYFRYYHDFRVSLNFFQKKICRIGFPLKEKKTKIIKFFQLEGKRQKSSNFSNFMLKDTNHQIFPTSCQKIPIIKFFQLHDKRHKSSNFSNFMQKEKNHQIFSSSWKKKKNHQIIPTSWKTTKIIQFFQLHEKR